jgi:hypothetical protein
VAEQPHFGQEVASTTPWPVWGGRIIPRVVRPPPKSQKKKKKLIFGGAWTTQGLGVVSFFDKIHVVILDLSKFI